MFLSQLLLAFQDAVYIADMHSGVDFPHSTEWLAGVKPVNSWPGYKILDDYDSDDALPMCSVWYRLLYGELRLRKDPEFTVCTLEMCLFALSGSVFLLMIR